MSRILIIPDVHQDLHYLSWILDTENLDRFDQVIFLGDYFDANMDIFAGEAATRLTATFLLELVKSYPRKVRLLWGNHDILYCRLREYVLRVDPGELSNPELGPELRETFERALWVNQVWPGDMWFRMELALVCDSWLLSHAGFHPDFWKPELPKADALGAVSAEWNEVIGNLFENEDHPLLSAGEARGGEQPVGGPIWCDWDKEFVDEIPYKQLVGHTAGPEPRQNGRSWCIDTGQRGYAILEEGELVLRTRD
jgi:hypothetical protein